MHQTFTYCKKVIFKFFLNFTPYEFCNSYACISFLLLLHWWNMIMFVYYLLYTIYFMYYNKLNSNCLFTVVILKFLLIHFYFSHLLLPYAASLLYSPHVLCVCFSIKIARISTTFPFTTLLCCFGVFPCFLLFIQLITFSGINSFSHCLDS